MALAWITYRTEQAVINIKDGRWAPTEAAIRDLLSALRSGKLIAHGMFEGERIPHQFETAVWSSFEIVVERHGFWRANRYRTEDEAFANPVADRHGVGGHSQEIVAKGQANCGR